MLLVGLLPTSAYAQDSTPSAPTGLRGYENEQGITFFTWNSVTVGGGAEVRYQTLNREKPTTNSNDWGALGDSADDAFNDGTLTIGNTVIKPGIERNRFSPGRLKRKVTYQVRVRAITIGSDPKKSAWTDIEYVIKAPLARPTNLELKPASLSKTGFTVGWDKVENVPGYTATATPTSGTAVTGGTVDRTGTRPLATFTGLNPGTKYTVSVTATGNADYEDSEASEGFSVTTFSGLSLRSSPLTVTEGSSITYTVMLPMEPTADVTVTVTVTGSGDVTVDTDGSTAGNQSMLTFTTMNWDTEQTVTVRASQDDDHIDDNVTLSHTAANTYVSVTGDVVEITVDDDDTPALVFPQQQVLSPQQTLLLVDPLPVDEGARSTYTVALATQPSANVTVAVAVDGSSDVTVDTDGSTMGDQSMLTFTTMNWDTEQTVTVSAAEDINITNETATLNHTASGGGYNSVTGIVIVTVDDDDEPALVFPQQSLLPVQAPLPVDEGASNSYTVALAAQPSANVTVAVAVDGSSDVTVDTDGSTTGDQTMLTFTTMNWDTEQTVTVSAAEDTNITDETATLNHTASGGGYNSVTGSVMVTVDDDDEPALVFTQAPLTVDEGGSNSYTVALATQPSANVMVAVAVDGSSDVTIDTDGSTTGDQTTLTFTTMNWSTAQTVTVSAAEDTNMTDETVTLNHTASGGGYNSVTGSVMVTVVDNDKPALVFTQALLPVDEGASNSYTVALATQPSANVTVAVAVDGSSDVTIDTDGSTTGDQTTLTFTTMNWSTAQTVTVSAAEDTNITDETATLNHTASGGGYNSVTGSVMVTVDDDDEPALVFTQVPLTVDEGASNSYTVALAAQPLANVMVAVTVDGLSDVTVDTDGSTTGDQTTLTFTTMNWGTEQTVTVSAAEDTNMTDETVTLNHTASGGVYNSVTGSVMVTVVDDDKPALVFTQAPLTVDEGGSNSYTVALATQPSANVTVAVAVDGSSDVTVDTDGSTTGDQTTLTFTTMNWSTAQTVTVSAAEDTNMTDETATLNHTASGGGYNSVTGSVMVTVVDDDKPALVFTQAPLTVDEGGSNSYTVALATQPSANVMVAVTVDGLSDVTVDTDGSTTGDQTTLTFTTMNWSTAQTVTVSAAEDTNMTDETVTLNHTASGGGYNSVTGSVMVTVVDNDKPALVFTQALLPVDEGASNSYTVALATQPSANVTVAVAVDGSSDVTIDTDGSTTGDQTTLTFTTMNWSTAQTVTVSAAEDTNITDETATLNHTASGGGYNSVTGSVMVTVVDDEPALVFTQVPLTVDEGASNSYTVALAAQPLANVMVAVTVDGLSDVTVDTDGSTTGDQTTLTFTTMNWGTEQTVTVSAAEDTNMTDETVTLNHTASGGVYNSVTGSVMVTVVDDDKPALVFTQAPLTVDEGGSNSYTVALATQPSANVMVAVTVDGLSDVTVDTDGSTTGDQTTLTFTTMNWGTEQTVTVSAAEDTNMTDETVTLNHTASGGVYNSVTGSVMVTVVDDDKPALVFTQAPLTVDEGGSNSYTVALATQPSANVMVAVTVDGLSDVTVDTDGSTTGDQTTLTFTTMNWGTEQTVTVSAAEDTNMTDETVTLNHTASGGGYNSVTGSVMVTVVDDDKPALVFTQAPLTVDEGGSNSYTVALATQPSANVMVAVAVDGSSDVTIDTDGSTMGDQSMLTFTTMNWGTEQTVTVSAAEDTNMTDETVTLNHTASGGGYNSVTGSVMVTVDDDDSNQVPTVANTIPHQSATVDMPFSFTVPSNTFMDADGDILTYSATKSDDMALPSWLSFNESTRVFSGTPTSTDTGTLSVKVTASDGTESISATFDIVVSAMVTKEKLEEVNEEVAPSIINEVARRQIAIITDRFSTISSGSPMGSLSMEEVVTDVADYLLSHHQDIQTNGFDWRQALSGNSFSFALTDISVSQGRMENSKSSSSSSGPLSFWGAIDYSSLEDKIEDFDLDGDITSFDFGVDKEFRSDLVAGVLLSITNSEFDLTQGSTDSTYEVDIATVNPYMSWEASEDLSLWASVGYGRGQADLTGGSTNPPASKSGDFTRFSAGGRVQLWQSEAGTALALKMDGTTAHFLEADMQNSRLATEISHGFSIESGVLNTALELGLLMSSADESAAELAGRLHWQGDAGFSASARSRVLLGGGDRNQWGIGGALRYTTGGAGEGLMMSLEPSFGISNPQLLSDLWSATRSDLAITTEAPTARLNAKLAYGFPSSDGLLTPYTDLFFSETTSTYATGLRYGLPTGLDLSLKGMRKTSATDAAENTILLELRSDL